MCVSTKYPFDKFKWINYYLGVYLKLKRKGGQDVHLIPLSPGNEIEM